jgi:tubulin polyglutamylase TTLL5
MKSSSTTVPNTANNSAPNQQDTSTTTAPPDPSNTTDTSNSSSKSQPEIHNYWILKPVGLSRGRGIVMIQSLADVVYSQSSVIQKYIERPLCLDNYKFDLRLYIVVTSFKPLEAFIYRDGFARVSTHSYSLDPNDKNNKFIHLTNSSIQKQNLAGPTSDNPLNSIPEGGDDSDAGGSKIGLLGKNGLWSRL